MQQLESSAVIDSLGFTYLRELATFRGLSDEVIESLMNGGTISRIEKGEYLARFGESASEFQIVLRGRIAFYKHSEQCDVLTRHFRAGEQMGFDLMMGLIAHNGTDVAVEDTLLLDVSSGQFFDLHVDCPDDFGLLMINLARELSLEIAMLEDVIGKTTGWQSGQ